MSERLLQLVQQVSVDVLQLLCRPDLKEANIQTHAQACSKFQDRERLVRLIEEIQLVEDGLPLVRGLALGRLRGQSQPPTTVVVTAPFDTVHRSTVGVFAELVDQASRTLDVCSYVMGHVGELLPILVSARNRGVDVRVILDRQVMASPSTGGALEQLRQAIGRESVRTWIGAHSESMHAKFVIADGAVALVTSANLTGHAMVRNVEVGLHTEDQDVVSQLSSFFGRLWVAGDGSESFIQGSDQ